MIHFVQFVFDEEKTTWKNNVVQTIATNVLNAENTIRLIHLIMKVTMDEK